MQSTATPASLKSWRCDTSRPTRSCEIRKDLNVEPLLPNREIPATVVWPVSRMFQERLARQILLATPKRLSKDQVEWLYSRACLISHGLIRYFFAGPGRIPIFCAHFISVRQFAQVVTSFYALEAFCSGNTSFAVSLLMSNSDARLFCKHKQVNLKNKPKIGNFTEKQVQHALAGKFNETKNYQEN